MPLSLQERKFRTLFRRLDRTGNGTLEPEDLLVYVHDVLQRSGWPDDDERAKALRNAARSFWMALAELADGDGDGAITPAEFSAFYARLANETRERGSVPPTALGFVTGIFRVLDHDGDGEVTRQEYALYLEVSGCKAPAAEVFTRLDHNGDGKLTANEVALLFQEFLTSDDPNAPGNFLLIGAFDDSENVVL